MKILAADIGGTHSRFAASEIQESSNIDLTEVFVFPTGLESINSLSDLLDYFCRKAPAEMADYDQYQAISLAIAGAVSPIVGAIRTIPSSFTSRTLPRLGVVQERGRRSTSSRRGTGACRWSSAGFSTRTAGHV